MKEYITYVVSAVLAVLAAYVNSTEWVQKSGAGMILTIALVFLMVIAWAAIATNWVEFKWIRRHIKRYSIEGYWIEYLREYPNGPISYGVIAFEGKQFRFHGDNYNLEGKLVGKFKCRHIEVNKSGENLWFHFAGTLIRQDPEAEPRGEIQGRGEITFTSESGEKYDRGDGTFTEGNKTIPIHLHKVPSEVIKKVYGSSAKTVDSRHIKKLIVYYLNEEWFREEYGIKGNPPTQPGSGARSTAADNVEHT